MDVIETLIQLLPMRWVCAGLFGAALGGALFFTINSKPLGGRNG